MPFVLGVDPGGKTGFALIDAAGPRLLHRGVLRVGSAARKSDPPYWPSAERLVEGASRVAIEDSGVLRSPSVKCRCKVMATATRALAARVGGWTALAAVHRVDVATPHPQSWKSALVWNGSLKGVTRELGKRAYILVAERTFGVSGLTEDEAAASLIALYVAEGLWDARQAERDDAA